MALLETKGDMEFADTMRRIANSLNNVSESLEKVVNKDTVSDEQVKDIIKSYPKEDLLELLNYDQKDYIYRKVWAEHVSEDVHSLCKDEGYDEVYTPDIAEQIAYRYAFEGDYDCNLSYWQNLKNLFEEER